MDAQYEQTQFHEQFKSLSCPANSTWKGSQMAITIGAGVQDGELYDFAQEHNVMAAGGTNMVRYFLESPKDFWLTCAV